MTVQVLVNGAQGRMGVEAVKAITNDNELSLVGTAGRNDDLGALIEQLKPNVVVDLTNADVVYANTKTIIEHGAHPVIGSSGLTPAQIQELEATCKANKLGGIIVPNFSIGAVLMMQLSQQAAKYFSYVEIIEQHHEKKLDSPSGTAAKTASMISEARKSIPDMSHEKELQAGARGATVNAIPIHSVRLPGLVAKQQVIFGGLSETLTIEHNSQHRESFMPGLLMACKKVVSLNSLVYGLDKIL